MSLQRNFTFSQDGWTFHYLAASARLQIYIPARSRQSGVVDPFYEHIDEIPGTLTTRREGKQTATTWIESNGTADDYREEMKRWRPDLVL